MLCTISTAVNDEGVLERCLLASANLEGVQILRQTGYVSAGSAHNAAIERADNDLILFAHQDVYLPLGWLARLEEAVRALESAGIQWGVLGVFGMTVEGEARGWVYSTGMRQVVGKPFSEPARVRTL